MQSARISPVALRAALIVMLPVPAAFSSAQAQEVLFVPENVRDDWGQVLRVDPVYQTLRANRVEQQCTRVRAEPEEEDRSLGGRIADAVRGVMGRSEQPRMVEHCREVPVAQEFHRPIAYDVEYVYKGSKYRSRLPYDPGHRIRLRVSVTPWVPPSR